MEDVPRLASKTLGCGLSTVTPEQYARAKELFIDLVDKPERDRESQLTSMNASDTEVVREVRGLLQQHSSRTILASTDGSSTTTIQNQSFSTLGLKRVSYNLFGGVLPLASVMVLVALMIF